LKQHQSLATSEHSLVKGTPEDIEAWLMSLPQDSHVSPSQSQESKQEKMTQEICGLPQSSAFAWYDPDMRCWRTSQACLIADISDEFSETYPKQGIMQDGGCFLLEMKALPLKGGDFLLPSPTAAMGKRGWGVSKTGRDRYSREIIENALSFGYKPHPQVLEWAMGFPITWTELKPLAMDKFQQWLEQHGIY
jgi:hypothetical protein